MTEESLEPEKQIRQSYESLMAALAYRDELLDRLQRRENITLVALVTILLIGIISVILAFSQLNTIVQQNAATSKQNNQAVKKIQQTQQDVNAISSAPQSGAAANRKFIFLALACQKTTSTVEEFDKCISDHFKLQYRCGQDKDDNKICVPLSIEPK